MKLEKYSLGMGDRFLHQGEAQLRAVIEAGHAGVPITPVWNKSDREHKIVGTEPVSLRQEADAAAERLKEAEKELEQVEEEKREKGNLDGNDQGALQGATQQSIGAGR